MAHFARVNAQGIVEQVIVAEQDFIDTLHGGVHTNGGTPLRKNYAGIGYTYDPSRDAFIPPKPYSQWVLNEQTCFWDAPTQMPNDGKEYQWDEQLGNWVEAPAQGE